MNTNQVIASMKAAARNFVRTNRKQMFATLPKDEQPKPKAKVVSIVDPKAVMARINTNTIFDMKALRRIVEDGNRRNYTGDKYRIVRQPGVLFFVHKGTDTVHAEIHVRVRRDERVLTARMINGGKRNRLTNYVHRESRLLDVQSMLKNSDAEFGSLIQQVRQVHAYIGDDIGEVAISIVEDLKNMSQTGVRKSELRVKTHNLAKK